MTSKILLIGNLVACSLLGPPALSSYPSEITDGDVSISGASGAKVNYPPNFQFPNSPERVDQRSFRALFVCKIGSNLSPESDPIVLGYFKPRNRSEDFQVIRSLQFLTSGDRQVLIPISEIPQDRNLFIIQGTQDRPPLNCSGIPQNL